MATTSIEWTDRTWNPVTGCTKVSPGCDRCYADAIARRFAGTPAFPHGFAVTLLPGRLDAPLRWRRPSRVFVNSMSDLFHDAVPDDYIARVFAVMTATPEHTYQVLTKRHGRMRSLLGSEAFWTDHVRRHARVLARDHHEGAGEWAARVVEQRRLGNVWLGVSAEDQQRARLRIPALLATPAAVRFVSAEPLVGPIELPDQWGRLDWLIVGGESGPGARPMDPAWAAALITRCRALGVAPFVKQLGSAYGPGRGADPSTWPAGLRVREFPTATATATATGGAS